MILKEIWSECIESDLSDTLMGSGPCQVSLYASFGFPGISTVLGDITFLCLSLCSASENECLLRWMGE